MMILQLLDELNVSGMRTDSEKGMQPGELVYFFDFSLSCLKETVKLQYLLNVSGEVIIIRLLFRLSSSRILLILTY